MLSKYRVCDKNLLLKCMQILNRHFYHEALFLPSLVSKQIIIKGLFFIYKYLINISLKPTVVCIESVKDKMGLIIVFLRNLSVILTF